MQIKKILYKILNLLNLNKFYIMTSALISLLLFIYCIFPSFLSGNIIKSLMYIAPFYIFYIIFIVYILNDLKFLRFLIYPIILGTLFICTIKFISVFSNDYAELFFFISIFLFPICLIITEIYAIVQDIKTFKNTTLPKE